MTTDVPSHAATEGPAGEHRSLAGTVQRLSDRLDLSELVPRYAHLIDHQRWHELAEIFVADATADYSSIGEGGLLSGVSEIRSWLERNLGHRSESVPWHFVTDTIVLSLDTASASTISYMHNRYLNVIGVYHSTATRTEHGWRLAHLRLEAQLKPGTPTA